MKERILVVDDERTIRRVLCALLADAGYDVRTAASGEDAIEQAAAFRPDLALLDLTMPGLSGIETLARLRDGVQAVPPAFIIMTAHGTIRSAVEAMRQGAFDYVTKPFDNDELQLLVARALEVRRLERRVAALESQIEQRFVPDNMVAQSSAMAGVFRLVDRVARVDTTVLISGESGTGKELVARAIHCYSRRSPGPFVAVNCGAVPQNLLESTFFGHERGAFTDAKATRRGAFEEADGGTLFLDEVAELSPAAQAGLLRALAEGEIRRVGGERTIPVDVRVTAATNQDLQQAVDEGRFREDLYWRLNVVAIQLPPLRQRPEDIPPLVEHFLSKHGPRLGGAKPVDPHAAALLIAHDWPGNVRELENAIERALALAPGPTITGADLPQRIHGGRDGGRAGEAGDSPPGAPTDAASPVTLAEAAARAQAAVEARLIRDAIEATDGNRTLAAKRLGVSRKTLFNKMRTLGIEIVRGPHPSGAA